MKIIGKQIVVELPEKKSHSKYPVCGFYGEYDCECGAAGFNHVLSEVARMNPAWGVDEEAIFKICIENGSYGPKAKKIAKALTSNPSAWMKRKESE